MTYTDNQWPINAVLKGSRTSLAKPGRKWFDVPLHNIPQLFGGIISSTPPHINFFECLFVVKKSDTKILCDIEIKEIYNNTIELHAQPSTVFTHYIRSIALVNIKGAGEMPISLGVHGDGLFWEKTPRCY